MRPLQRGRLPHIRELVPNEEVRLAAVQLDSLLNEHLQQDLIGLEFPGFGLEEGEVPEGFEEHAADHVVDGEEQAHIERADVSSDESLAFHRPLLEGSALV